MIGIQPSALRLTTPIETEGLINPLFFHEKAPEGNYFQG